MLWLTAAVVIVAGSYPLTKLSDTDVETAVWTIYAGVANLFLGDPKVISGVNWSADGRRITFVRDGIFDHERFVVALDTGGERRISDDEYKALHPAPDGDVSPDGLRIVYDKQTGRETESSLFAPREIFVRDRDGRKAPRQLTDTGGEASNPVWLPDGGTIAYLRESQESGDVKVLAMDAGGAHSRLGRLGQVAGWWEPSWSENGRFLVYTELGDDIHLLRVEDGKRRLLLEGCEGIPDWAPGSRRIACPSKDNTIIVLDLSTGTRRDLHVPNGSVDEVSWSPDGTRIAFTVPDGDGQLFVIDADGRHVLQLTGNGG